MRRRLGGKPAEAKDTPLTVGVGEVLDRVTLEKRAAFSGGNAERAAQLRAIDRRALREFPVKGNGGVLLVGREGPQMRPQCLPIGIRCGDAGREHGSVRHRVSPAQQDVAAVSPERCAWTGGHGTEP